MIRRAPKDRENPYAQVNRALLQNRSLTFQARGLLAYVLSKPRNWQAKDHDLMKEGGIGKAALRTILDELKTHGHACRISGRSGGGKFEYDLEIYEDPQPINEEQPSTDYRLADNPSTDDQAAAIYSTCADARPLSDHKDQNTQRVCADSASPQSPGEDSGVVTEQASSPTVPSDVTDNPPPGSEFVSVGNVLARIDRGVGFDAADSRRKALAARPGAKRKSPKAPVPQTFPVPEKFYATLSGPEKRELATNLDFDRGEFEKRVEAWELSRRERRLEFLSPDSMKANLRKYLVNCDLNKHQRRAS